MTAGASPEDLVQTVRATGIRDERVLEAIRATPRAEFVPAEHATAAYIDIPIEIGHGQVTTQPSLTARMIEGLGLRGKEHVLEIGTGLGFQTALLAYLAADVVSVERWPDLARQARQNLARQAIHNVKVITGDGSGGVPEHAPYDAIIVSAAFPQVPEPLTRQLRLGGRLVQPIGPGGQEDVVLFHRTPAGLKHQKILTPASFVRLHGRFGFPG
ncbi:protein-L-isoaspartate(D-aspartate) O-methyltransferase [Actinoallomurus sp. NPDC050550]|uniref:protein-L-isoaspartate(D-aspartate) O-methyltransferase n=1 Tax=Actinoallomurus sp. NPDC050550 TaxID=3154937 RepID=UPI0033E83C8E